MTNHQRTRVAPRASCRRQLVGSVVPSPEVTYAEQLRLSKCARGSRVHRYYDPTTGQFLSVDPLVGQTGQPYAYAGDNPINVSDPLGLRGWYCINGQTHYYKGNKYGVTGNGKCASAVSNALSAYTNDGGRAAIEFLNSRLGHAMEWVDRNSTPIIIGAQVVGAAITLGAAAPEEVTLDINLDATELNLSDTVVQHASELTKSGELSRPYISSLLTTQSILDAGDPSADPGGVPGGLRWDVPGSFRGTSGTWQLVVDPNTNSILHYLFVGG